MKYILYTLSALLIVIPIISWIAVYKGTLSMDVIIHDSYVGLEKFKTTPKTVAFISIAIGFLLLALTTHIEYKKQNQAQEIKEKL